ncbi:succinylglutamate desuccinylase/aspartoacylase family protein [Haloplanus ruber]|uniref:Succinylglutamate desuccinylase/aspartoacylase family protein n=1 Tax=Haloplanus ruber TaxID=869892 RepID=A0ABD6CXT3_9EURY|nr:succinylglutamate desuccinylase/aspartoacylase family protein [Haloplanus ruber]
MTADGAFTYDGGKVAPGERQNLRYRVSETYFGDPVRIPVTVINGERPGPTMFLSAAAHGDELNGIAVVRSVAYDWDLATLAGTIVCLPVLNVPGFLTQQRYLPIYDRDLNRSFPGDPTSTSAKRMAHAIFRNFVEPCDLGIDFHTSTRGRTNTLHVRADVDQPAVSRLAHAFGSSVIVDGAGSDGTLRGEATRTGVPTVTIEMGEAHRFERPLIDDALAGVRSVFAEYGLWDRTQSQVRWPGWRTVVTEKTWIRADAGGIVDMHYDRGDVIQEGERLCTITDPFKDDGTPVEAPFTGVLLGVLENPVVYPGNPICHLAEIDEETAQIVGRRAPDR